jgi:hypothetical protein
MRVFYPAITLIKSKKYHYDVLINKVAAWHYRNYFSNYVAFSQQENKIYFYFNNDKVNKSYSKLTNKPSGGYSLSNHSLFQINGIQINKNYEIKQNEHNRLYIEI